MMRRIPVAVIVLVLFCCRLPMPLAAEVDVPAHRNAGSFDFIKKAAKKGHSKAAYYLATYYYHGTGTAVDKRAAAFWFKKAADAGVADAQFAYGLLLLSGEGVGIDKDAAFEWLGRAARQEHQPARQVLKELLTYRGSASLGIGGAVPPGSLEQLAQNPGSDRLRLEGKGVLLDRGSFGLKFSLPPLVDPLAPGTLSPPKLNQMLERLQGGTVDIIIRP